jgi:ApeA N-terminal domain 1
MEQFEHTGYWWLPNEPNKKISGSLKYHPLDGIALELIGSFREFKDLLSVREEHIILGVTSGGKLVTLYKCFESKASFSLDAGLSSSRFVAKVLFLGHHFEKPEDVVFSTFSVGYCHLEEWVGITGFSIRHEADESGKLSREIVTYSFPEEIHVDVGDVRISITYRFTSGGTRLREVLMKHITYFKVSTRVPVSFEVFDDKINFLLQNFLSFGLGRATRPVFITATNNNVTFEFPEGTSHYQDIEIYYAVNEIPDVSRSLHPLEMTFSLSDIHDNLGGCLNNWFSKEQILRPVYDLYFVTLNSSSIYLTHEFLNLAQGLESYHRRVIGGDYVSDAVFGNLLTALEGSLPAGLPENYKTALKQRFKHLNEYSLRKRLGELITKCSPIVLKFIKEPDVYVNRIVATRNYLTHYDKEPEQQVLHGEDLYWATRKLRALLETCLMLEIGLPVETITKLVTRNQQINFLSQK